MKSTVERTEAAERRLDSSSFALETSTKGVVSFGVKNYGEPETLGSAISVNLSPEFWAEVVKQGIAARKAFKAINGEV